MTTSIKFWLLFSVSCVGFLPGSAWAQSPGERGFGILQQGVQDAKEEPREKAVHALGLLVKDERAMKLAESALADRSAEVRAAAATVLGQIGLPASIPRLQEALRTRRQKSYSRRRALSTLWQTLVPMRSITRSSPARGRPASLSWNRSSRC